MKTEKTMPEYAPGDIVTGRFSCTYGRVQETAEVTARFTEKDGRGAFIGRNWSPPEGMGWGVWGYDDEIDTIVPELDKSRTEVMS